MNLESEVMTLLLVVQILTEDKFYLYLIEHQGTVISLLKTKYPPFKYSTPNTIDHFHKLKRVVLVFFSL